MKITTYIISVIALIILIFNAAKNRKIYLIKKATFN